MPDLLLTMMKTMKYACLQPGYHPALHFSSFLREHDGVSNICLSHPTFLATFQDIEVRGNKIVDADSDAESPRGTSPPSPRATTGTKHHRTKFTSSFLDSL
jgi:hypothetical protein